MILEFPIGSTLKVSVPPIGADRSKQFTEATRSIHCSSWLPTLATIFRDAEFQWLDKLQVDWHRLLHAEQKYDFHAPLPLDAACTVESKIVAIRTRKSSAGSMTFIELETKIFTTQLCVTALSNFVVREPA